METKKIYKINMQRERERENKVIFLFKKNKITNYYSVIDDIKNYKIQLNEYTDSKLIIIFFYIYLYEGFLTWLTLVDILCCQAESLLF